MEIKYFDEITEAAEQYHLDPLMVAAVVAQESAFKRTAKSPVGAQGLMQIMPRTFTWLRELMNEDEGDVFNVKDNLESGCYYLNWLKKYFTKKFPALDGTNLWRIVWAGYNAGQGNIRKMLNLALEKEDDDAYKYSVWKEYLPEITGNHSKETINYVKRISGYWREFVSEKEDKNGSDPGGSMTVSRKRLSCLLTLVRSTEKELEQLLNQVDSKEEE